jgi:hypothetical protein
MAEEGEPSMTTQGVSTGGCQCGAVRYSATLKPEGAHLCHCRMCQKAAGNLFAALVGADHQALVWTRGTPATFKSSAKVERGFCAACGTPLFYRETTQGHIALMIGSLDNPAAVPPLTQVGAESRMPWFDRLPSLKDNGETEAFDPPDILAAIRASNRQHPDHDTAVWPLGETE